MVRVRSKLAAVCLIAGLGVAPAFAQDAGADTFKVKCLMCHGVDGTAQTPAGKAFKAASFSDPAIIKVPDSERLVIVKSGKNKMPAFGDKLTDAQIRATLAYIRTLENAPPK